MTIDSSLLAALRQDLVAAKYTVESVAELLGPMADAAMHREQQIPALLVTERSDAPALMLLRLFTLGQPVRTDDMGRALPSLGVDGAVQLGLVESTLIDGVDYVRPLVDLRPYAAVDDVGAMRWWLASDLGELATGRALHASHVLGAGGASLTLAAITMREPVGRTLDIGTGCGIQALHAARHSREVVATDLSQRALNFAAFNAELNDIHNISFRHGSMLDPVRGEVFDLVVSNPPFVITPRQSDAIPDYEYRDGGRAGDSLVEELVTGIAEVMAPGGAAQLLMNWEHHRGEPWQERIGRWLDTTPLDAWVVQREILDPAEYAETWLRDGGITAERESEQWRAGYEAYLRDFAARGVTAVGMGMVLLHRPAASKEVAARPTWRRLDEHPGAVAQPLGPVFAAGLRMQEFLACASDQQVAALRCVVAVDVTEERYYRPGEADPAVMMLRQGGGFQHSVHVSSAVAAVVGASDGELTVGQLLSAVASLTDQDAAALAAEVFPAIRGLLADGLLTIDR